VGVFVAETNGSSSAKCCCIVVLPQIHAFTPSLEWSVSYSPGRMMFLSAEPSIFPSIEEAM
jgi:hypothetical protein